MATVFFTMGNFDKTISWAQSDYRRAIKFAKLDIFQSHTLVGSPEAADIIVFMGSFEPNYSDITSSKVYKKFKDRSVLLDIKDQGIPFIPGLYSCLENTIYNKNLPFLKSGFYLRVTENISMELPSNLNNAKYLYSFMGNALNHQVRQKVMSLSDERALLIDSSGDSHQQCDGVDGVNFDRGMRYQNAIEASKFILCPRGIGVSSWRIFETMRAGRVPVIISDGWVPPDGPDWNACCIRVKESEIDSLPCLLRDMEFKSPELGKQARDAWLRYYSEGVVFNTLIDQLVEAQEFSQAPSVFWRFVSKVSYLRPIFIRHWVISPFIRRLRRVLS